MARFAPIIAFVTFVLLTARQSHSITIEFDYSLDANQFFSDPARVKTLEAAAAIYENLLTDHLAAIEPSGDNWWNFTIPNPSTGGAYLQSDMTVPEDTIIIFAGGRDLGGDDLGSVDIGIFSGDGDEQWLGTVQGRGQPNAVGVDVATDFGHWGGAITFDTTNMDGTPCRWNFQIGSGPTADQHDFLSATLNVLQKVFGIGTADSWERWTDVENHTFRGPRSVEEFGRPVPFRAGEGEMPEAPPATHFDYGTLSPAYPNGELEMAVNTSPLLVGERKLITRLDVAALQDIGWEIAPELALLQPGDANQDLSFDQQDMVRILQSQKYLTGQAATWGEGDWNGAPGGYPGNPPPGDGVFDQRDFVAASQGETYMTGPYAALVPNSPVESDQTSFIDSVSLGATAVDAVNTSIPEPSSVVLFVLGLFGLMISTARRC